MPKKTGWVACVIVFADGHTRPSRCVPTNVWTPDLAIEGLKANGARVYVAPEDEAATLELYRKWQAEKLAKKEAERKARERWKEE